MIKRNMRVFVQILILTLFFLLSVQIEGRDIGIFKSPLQTIVNISFIDEENDDLKTKTNEEIDAPFSVDEDDKQGIDVLDESEVETRQIGCSFNIKDLSQRTPLLRNPKTKEILYPDTPGSSVVTLKKGEHMEIDCPGSKVQIEGRSVGKIVDAVCSSGSNFKILGHVVSFGDVLCQRRVNSVAKYSGQTCFKSQGKEIEIGFQFSDGYFFKLISSCFEEKARQVFYTSCHVHHRIGDGQSGGTRPTWSEGTFYNLSAKMNNIYPNKAQRVHINRQIGLSDDDTTYVKPTGNYFLAKGHLTANADLFYFGEQGATFWYVNSLPQWQTFNGGNWASLERNVRQLAGARRLELDVLTGGYGHSTLPSKSTGKPVQLYLYVDDKGNQAVPVPDVFYKIVYSPSTKRGVAIIGVNNPYKTEAEVRKSVYCNDVADQLTWLSFDRFNANRGYIYACTITDFKKLIPDLPSYRVAGLLK